MSPEQELAELAQRQRVLAEVQQWLVKTMNLRRTPDELDPDTALFGSGLGLDSVDAVDLVVGVESTFAAPVPKREDLRWVLRTVGTLVEHIMQAGRRHDVA